MGIWLVSAVIQAFKEAPYYIEMFSQDKCSATGYPLTKCLLNSSLVSYLINIAFWFVIVYLLSGLFKRQSS